LLAKGGQHDQARHDLAKVYGRFTEGFETADLSAARQLMEDLAFAFGGEYMNAVTLNLESVPPGRRGFLASWVNASGSAGIILAVGLVSLFTLCFGTAQFQNWLWRVPFRLSVVLAGLGTYVRMRFDESRLFKAVQSEKRIVTVPLLCVLRGWKTSTALAVGVNMVHSSFYYLTTVFVLGYLVKERGVSETGVTTGTAIANVIEIVTVPLIASFSDRWGRPALYHCRYCFRRDLASILLPVDRSG
jgi:MFS family permease